MTGAGGQLGRDLARALASHEALLLDRASLDVSDREACRRAVSVARPDAIVHAAAYTDVDGCEGEPERARRVNVEGTRNVVEAAGSAFVIVVSTDYVFDGALHRAYVETDEPNPIQVYGYTKWQGERAALAASRSVAIARSAWLYGEATASGARARNFVHTMLDLGEKGAPFEVVDDQVGSPTATADLARALVALAEFAAPGVFHVANGGAVSRYDFACAVLAAAGMDPRLVHPVPTGAAPHRPARRPPYAPLEGRAWREAGFPALRSWDEALIRAMPGMLEAR